MRTSDSGLREHDRRQPGHPCCPAPNLLPAFPRAVRVKPKAGRTRWRDPNGTVLEWDSHDGGLHMFGMHGWHLGQYDHVHGGNLKLAEPGRRTPI